MTYSADFRRQVFLVKEKENLSLEQVAKRFGIGKATIFRWTKRLEAKRTRHKLATKINADTLRKDVELYPDAYQYERAKRLGVSRRGIGYALKRLGMSRKKNIFSSKSQ
jgi:transposase